MYATNLQFTVSREPVKENIPIDRVGAVCPETNGASHWPPPSSGTTVGTARKAVGTAREAVGTAR